ncbi:acyl-CoA dehydrogenase family protein [Xylophilus sp. GOD-11R]|uniref:acyl-CoA dehydrogenase family protein n=1 Tax=Xylophilus sp. GOD-11R TaxID=3089814 RepID=UPI00298C9360|nr:acyl-CoA dehydrogenase family protein [Xylophilus sp. GOD-11R]WPB55756.1 acyl-CoA dehydrogenase family protein [Xylophilus sp. GOD-11R]
MPDPNPGETLSRLQRQHGAELRLSRLLDAHLDELPLPGAGRTLDRWRWLAAVAACDLSLVKLFEGHTDALAILAELGGPDVPPGSAWGTWCAEPPDARLEFRPDGDDGRLRIDGTKAWCSGAASVDHALVSGWDADGRPCLAAVALRQPGVRVTDTGWQAVGMAGSASVNVCFDRAVGQAVGGPGDYTARPGFWQGGIGVAACWFGGAQAIADMAMEQSRGRSDPHRLAHLGEIDVALSGAAAVLREAAAAIDSHPQANAQELALRARLVVEAACDAVLRHATRALGAGPLCRNARFARLVADLPVYLRQSHAERDLAALGQGTVDSGGARPWTL